VTFLDSFTRWCVSGLEIDAVKKAVDVELIARLAAASP
jgi:hypothetical protein